MKNVFLTIAVALGLANFAHAQISTPTLIKIVKAEDARGYHLLNLQFHDRLVEMAGNRKLAMIYRKLVKEIALFRRLNLAGQNVLPESAHAHWAILEAIKSGNPEVAGRAMFEHAMGSRNRTIENDELRRRADTTPTES